MIHTITGEREVMVINIVVLSDVSASAVNKITLRALDNLYNSTVLTSCSDRGSNICARFKELILGILCVYIMRIST